VNDPRRAVTFKEFPMLILCMLLAGLGAPAQPATDADVWTAVIAQLRAELGGRGELVIVAETLPSREFPRLSASTRESRLLKSLTERNAALGVIHDVQLPPKTRLGPPDSMMRPPATARPFFDRVDWAAFTKEFPFGMVLRMSLPAFSEDGTKAIIYYEATGGFDDRRGSYLIFEKQQGHWVVVDYVGYWIT
jgi:hypothetical protein